MAYACRYCGKKFERQQEYAAHIYKHKRELGLLKGKSKETKSIFAAICQRLEEERQLFSQLETSFTQLNSSISALEKNYREIAQRTEEVKREIEDIKEKLNTIITTITYPE
ncbi:MAG: hypothetical protein J7J91_06755 [Deltaproteobacteria bacterium]|nr:hypothetical protein [Deltaproteobacteria bacterium]